MVLDLLAAVVRGIFGRFYRLIGNEGVSAEIDFTKESNGGDTKDKIITFGPLRNEISSLITEDRISLLPDDILTSIVSSLTLKVAVKTSVLSRRWRYLSTSLSDINLDFPTLFGIRGQCWLGRRVHICKQNTPKFVQVVNQILTLHVGPKISSFRVAFCFEPEFACDIDRWICLAIRKGVEKLDLNFLCSCYNYMSKSDKMDECIELYTFSCQLLCEASKLKHLRLYSCILKTDFCCQIVGLTTLDLHYVRLAHGELHSVLSSCLNLQRLMLRGCRLPEKLSVFGPKRLTFLMVNGCEGVKEMELSAVNLCTFDFIGDVLIRLSFHLHKLEKIFVRIYSLDSPMPYNLSYLAKDLPQLKILQISVLHQVKLFFSSLNPFSNVKELNFFMTCDDRIDYSEIITPILRAFPLMQKLYIVVKEYWMRREPD